MKNIVTIGDSSLKLDFTGLFGKQEQTAQPIAVDALEKPGTTPKQEQAILLLREHEDARKTQQMAVEAYKKYQENIRASGRLRTSILKGVREGVDLYTLFLQAVKAISLMTGNELFYSQIKEDTLAIYGAGLQQAEPLQNELERTRNRLEKLTAAEQGELDPDARKRLQRAIEAHRKKLAEISR